MTQKRRNLTAADTGVLMLVGSKRLCIFLDFRVKPHSIVSSPLENWESYEISSTKEKITVHRYIKSNKGDSGWGGTLLTVTPFEDGEEIPMENCMLITNVNVLKFISMDYPLHVVPQNFLSYGYEWDGMVPAFNGSWDEVTYDANDIPIYIIRADNTEELFEPDGDIKQAMSNMFADGTKFGIEKPDWYAMLCRADENQTEENEL